MVTLLIDLCLFVITFFNVQPQPFKIILYVLEAVILVLVLAPLPMLHGPLW